jgi:NTP pyrophosphatase (non-canonical NTP hydrolase)
MNFNDYQTKAITTAVYPKHQALPYLALGLSGEAAEVANKVKKILRGDYDNDPEKAEEALHNISMELGDTLWYIAVLASELGTNLDLVATSNLDKLAARAEADTIKGSGDDR